MTHRLGREIGVALAAKVAALLFLYFAFFDHSHRTTITPTAVAAKLLSGSGAPGR
ncbi:MAG: phosphoglycerate mutase [Methylocystaceae bacterium]|nr:MAG: phosphoglycerate mutase [Methylocystaceae bacterium]